MLRASQINCLKQLKIPVTASVLGAFPFIQSETELSMS